MAARLCPALFIAAPASGQGKTTVTAALARAHRNAGRRVQVFKTGPDFLDPLILQQASGTPVYQLDLFMGGEAHCQSLLYDAAANSDLILVEGVMGLFDGEPSAADLAQRFGLPVLAVIDGSAMAQTFGALAHGLAHYRNELEFAGVIANRVATEGHRELLQQSLPAGINWYGALHRNEDITLPSRHLGLLMATEIKDLDDRIDAAAKALSETTTLRLPEPVRFMPPAVKTSSQSNIDPVLKGHVIAVARDAAFAFLYRANIETLNRLGAELKYFSPVAGDRLPKCDGVYLPGGYPELHLDALSGNHALIDDLKHHHGQHKPLLAECGGMLFLLDSLRNREGRKASMAGILPGHAKLQARLSNLGLHSVQLSEGELRGHSFHHTSTETSLTPVTHTEGARGKPEPIYRSNRLLASYFHFYFPSNPEAIGKLFQMTEADREKSRADDMIGSDLITRDLAHREILQDALEKPKLGNYHRHLLICTGPRCTPNGESQALFETLGAKFKAAGIDQGALRVKRTRTHCFASCKSGPIVCVQPDGVWYYNVTDAVLDRIIEEHLVNNQPVEDWIFHQSNDGGE